MTTQRTDLAEDRPGKRWQSLLLEWWPLIAAVALLFVIGWPRYAEAVNRNAGQWVYPLDDTYIHLGMAKTFATTGIWGLNPASGFASGNSSLLYPLLLGIFYLLTTIDEMSTLLLNLIFAVVLLGWIEARLRREGLLPAGRLLVHGAVVFLTPLPVVIMTGMEHIVQTLLSIMLLFAAAEVLATPRAENGTEASRRLTRRLAILCFLVPAVRYEGLFLVSVVCGLILLRGRWRLAFALGGIGLLPAAIYGWISLEQGWMLLPNSVLLKGNAPASGLSALKAFLLSGPQQLTQNPHLLWLGVGVALALIFQLWRDRSFWKAGTLRLVIWLGLLALHMQFAKTGWFFRYEAYLMVSGFVLLGTTLLVPLLARGPERRFTVEALAGFVVAVLVSWPSLPRAREAITTVARASTNVYEQQYQMARFLRAHYPTASVAANDVGAITFLTNIKCIDLFGLTNKEVLRAKRAQTYDATFIRRLTGKGRVDLAIVYDTWYVTTGGLPRTWTKVGEWRVFNNVVLGGEVVSFYAVKPELAADLANKLRQFSPELPKTVEQRGAYLAAGL